MSKFVRIKTELRNPILIKRALDDLKLRYKENERYTHAWSGFSGTVPFVIKQSHVTFALHAVENQSYEAIGDEMQLGVIRSTMNLIAQRYAYHSVLAETAKAGFDLVEEEASHDGVIRLTVRRWH